MGEKDCDPWVGGGIIKGKSSILGKLSYAALVFVISFVILPVLLDSIFEFDWHRGGLWLLSIPAIILFSVLSIFMHRLYKCQSTKIRRLAIIILNGLMVLFLAMGVTHLIILGMNVPI